MNGIPLKRSFHGRGHGCMENKRYQLKFLPLFEHDLNEITDYIVYRLRNPDAAAHLIDAVEKAINDRLPAAESFQPYR